MHKIVTIIPARGGSKRLPRKNVLPLAGKPLIAYSIEHAKQSRLANRVIVSTDDDEIACIAKQYGADIVRRPEELSTDTASSESSLLHVLEFLEKIEEFCPDMIVFLQCTSPLREQEDIDKAINSLIAQEADSLFSAFRFTKYIWHVTNGIVTSMNYDYKSERRREQEFPVQFQENGSIYVFKTWVLKELKNRLGGKIAIYEMDYLNSFQIDTPEDFQLCECILNMKSQRSRLKNEI